MMLEVTDVNGETYSFDTDGRFRIDGWEGISFWIVREQTEPDADTEWTGMEVPTGMLVAVMVGDDREHIVDPSDVTELAEGESCRECGQIGCTRRWEGLGMIHAVNESGERIALEGRHPRKELLDYLGRKSARRMYRDKADGRTVHVGYVVGGSWWTFYNVTPWEGDA